MENKIVTKEQFKNEVRPLIKADRKTIALCHGVFDLVHPGHVIHLKQAKEVGDVLVVSITAAKYVRKGPGRPYFDDDTRMQFLAALECVDYVLLSDGYTVDDIVEAVEPDFYVKGEEYSKEDEDLTGKIREERELVEKHGGRIHYTTGQTYSSTKLINTTMSGLSDEVKAYATEFKKKYTIEQIKNWADMTENLKVLVVGDIIIDKYTYCDVQGLISKEASYSARLLDEEEYLGGSVAIARHLSSFTNKVTLMSIMGNEEYYIDMLGSKLSGRMGLELFYGETFPTIVKHRYLTRNGKREEYRKIFTINNIPQKMQYEESVRKDFHDKLTQIIADYDVVFVCDFGHGLINQDTIDILESKSKYMVLNCQTNSSNTGLNIITKYSRADAFALDQKELKLAYPIYLDEEKVALNTLRNKLGGEGWLTRGSEGAYGIASEINECPAFTLNVKDTIGAGDSFLAVAGIMAATGCPNEVSLFMGNIGGALGANIIGNKDSIEKVNVLKYASTLLNV